MTNITIERHIDGFLSSIDPGGSFLKVAQNLGVASRHDASIRRAIEKVWLWANGPAISGRELDLYKQVRRPRNPYGTISGKASLALLGGLGYLRAKNALTKPTATTTFATYLANPDKFLETIEQGLIRGDAEFLGRLLVESEIRAGRDPAFDKSIREGVDSLRSYGPSLPKLRVFKASKVYDPDDQESIFLPDDYLSDPGGGPDSDPGGGDTDNEPVGCTLSPDDMDEGDWTCVAAMVIVIVIIIVVGY